MKPSRLIALLVVLLTTQAGASPQWEIAGASSSDATTIVLANATDAAPVVIDSDDYDVVGLSATFFADDVARVTGHRPVVSDTPVAKPNVVIAGTLGHSEVIDRLAADGKLKDLDKITGRWEATLWQIVEKPSVGVDRALIIVGSDRRGTAYGLSQLSEAIGVSPWYWWADVPAVHRESLSVKIPSPQIDSPGVRYRGIFVNDEDWGLNPWAKTTFDPELKNIGPKTYEKVFELMLRLRLNYIWPAMHSCSAEFGSIPQNAKLADRYAIVAGSSHCEPMLYNNVKWDVNAKGPWDYSNNRDVIHKIWEENAKARGDDEAVWTLGIRGIHDAAMQGPKAMPDRIKLVSEVISDERALLDQYVTKDWGHTAQCFVPYKEVQPIYDAGLEVPDDVTLVWADDNFGYLRRLSSPAERKRPGGAGFYYHISYYGWPHSYTWINTTAPALMWSEMHKAWENGARTIWMLNVGDIKPMEIGINYLARLAWNPDGFGPDSQPVFLRDFAAKTFGDKLAQPIADLLADYYRLGTIRKPELMNRAWALSLPTDQAKQLTREYQNLLDREESLVASIAPEARDSYYELVGFPARVLGAAGLIFMADRAIQSNDEPEANDAQIARWKDFLTAQVENYNQRTAGGKWEQIMPGLVTGKTVTAWNSQVRWPWGEKMATSGSTTASSQPALSAPPLVGRTWKDAAACDRRSAQGTAQWISVSGLGTTAKAMALLPTTLETSWANGGSDAPSMEFDFDNILASDAEALIDFLPTFRLVPGMKLRVAVSVDNFSPQLVEVPGSDGREDERGPVRTLAVQDNYTRLRVPLPGLSSGKHVFKISAVDPGAVVDRISLP